MWILIYFALDTKIILLDLLQNSDIQAHLAIDVHVWSCDLWPGLSKQNVKVSKIKTFSNRIFGFHSFLTTIGFTTPSTECIFIWTNLSTDPAMLMWFCSEHGEPGRVRATEDSWYGKLWPSHAGTAQGKQGALRYENTRQTESEYAGQKLFLWMYSNKTTWLLHIKLIPGSQIETSWTHFKWEENPAGYQLPIFSQFRIPFQGKWLSRYILKQSPPTSHLPFNALDDGRPLYSAQTHHWNYCVSG